MSSSDEENPPEAAPQGTVSGDQPAAPERTAGEGVLGRGVPGDGAAGPEGASSAEVDREHAEKLRRAVSEKSRRRIRSRERPDESVWAFLGTFGLVGWTVAVPTLAGLALGVFLDNRTDSERSFTITFLVLGVAVGCAGAWYWIRRESSGDGR